MTENLKVRCPLCEGHGALLRSELAARFTTPALRQRLDARIAEILEEAEVLAAVGGSSKARNFETEVHSWNPRLPMWRRSPKE